MKVVLINAKAEHGKNEFANELKKILEDKNKVVVIDSFAKYLKGYATTLGYDVIKKTSECRSFLQRLGNDVIKEELNYKSFHARRLAEDFQILTKVANIDFFLVPDLRMLDEVSSMRAMFGNDVITINIERIGYENSLNSEQKAHSSEHGLDGFIFDMKYEIEEGLNNVHKAAKNFEKKISRDIKKEFTTIEAIEYLTNYPKATFNRVNDIDFTIFKGSYGDCMYEIGKIIRPFPVFNYIQDLWVLNE